MPSITKGPAYIGTMNKIVHIKNIFATVCLLPSCSHYGPHHSPLFCRIIPVMWIMYVILWFYHPIFPLSFLPQTRHFQYSISNLIQTIYTRWSKYYINIIFPLPTTNFIGQGLLIQIVTYHYLLSCIIDSSIIKNENYDTFHTPHCIVLRKASAIQRAHHYSVHEHHLVTFPLNSITKEPLELQTYFL